MARNKELTKIKYLDPVDAAEAARREKALAIREEKKKRRRIRFAAVAVIICGVLLFLFRNEINLYGIRRTLVNLGFDVLASGGFENLEIAMDSSLQSDFAVYGRRLAILYDGRLCLYSGEGDEILEIDINYSNPVLESYGQYVICYDLGGKGLVAVRGRETVFELKADYAIQSAAINGSGYLSVVTDGKDSRAVIAVYSPSGTEIYRWYSYSQYILDTAVSPNGRQMTATGFAGGGGEIVGSILTFRLDEEGEAVLVSLPGELCYSVKYKSSGQATVISGKAAYIIDSRGAEVAKVDFGGRVLEYFSDGAEGVTSFVLNRHIVGSSSEVIVIDGSGKEMLRTDIEVEARVIGSSSRHTAVLTSGKILVFDNRTGEETVYNADLGVGGFVMSEFGDIILFGIDRVTSITLE